MQGSCFGPLLWNTFQTDVYHSVSEFQLSLYADDHELYISSMDAKEVEFNLNLQASRASQWHKTKLRYHGRWIDSNLSIRPFYFLRGGGKGGRERKASHKRFYWLMSNMQILDVALIR